MHFGLKLTKNWKLLVQLFFFSFNTHLFARCWRYHDKEKWSFLQRSYRLAETGINYMIWKHIHSYKLCSESRKHRVLWEHIPERLPLVWGVKEGFSELRLKMLRRQKYRERDSGQRGSMTWGRRNHGISTDV